MKTRRHAKILELIKAQDIDTQEELLRNLRACGFDVTQATVSRDIKEMMLIKVPDEDGRYKYPFPSESIKIPPGATMPATFPPSSIRCSAILL